MLCKTILAFILIALVETLNGIFRILYLQKKFQKGLARLISFLMGLSLVTILCLFLIPWIDPRSAIEALTIGIFLALGMTLYDIAIGRFIFKLAWSKILQDFNIVKGNLLTIGILVLAFLPYVIWMLMLEV
ncbi:MAG: hypothetical protein J7J31_01785 [Helicobacteraceae bacterium]|nr:hypothetical protein [Helicobacteraceae bacterium]